MSEEITSSEDSGTTPQTGTESEQDMVAITEASDEEIQAYLDRERNGGQPNSDEEKVVEASENSEESEEKAGEDQTNSEETTKEEEEDPATKEIRELKEQVKKLSERTENDQKFISRRNTELGNLRKQNEQLDAAYKDLQQKILDTKDEDPYEAAVMKQQADEIARRHQNNDHQIQLQERIEQNEQLLLKHFKPGDIETQDIVKVLEEDGISDEFINRFANNPLGELSPIELLHVSKRAYDMKHRGSVLSAKEKEIEELKKQLEAAKKQPDQLLERVQNAGKLGNGVRGKTGGSTAGAKPTLTPEQLANLSPEEFEKVYSSYIG